MVTSKLHGCNALAWNAAHAIGSSILAQFSLNNVHKRGLKHHHFIFGSSILWTSALISRRALFCHSFSSSMAALTRWPSLVNEPSIRGMMGVFLHHCHRNQCCEWFRKWRYLLLLNTCTCTCSSVLWGMIPSDAATLFWRSDMPVPRKASWEVVVLRLWSRSSTAAVVNRFFCRMRGHTVPSDSYFWAAAMAMSVEMSRTLSKCCELLALLRLDLFSWY